jgi:hemerythrin-like metal-binding protein
MGSHFGNGERLMREIGFSDLDRHAARHKEIVAKMNRIVTSCHTLEQLHSRLRHLMLDWVLTHILRHDRAIALSRHRSAPLPANAGTEPGRG